MRRRPLLFLQSTFVDSSAYYAASSRRDTNHDLAQHLFTELVRLGTRLITTRYILAETHALVINRQRDSRAAAALLQRIESSERTTVTPVTGADEGRARAILMQYHDHLFTLTDATSFAAMERLGIGYAVSFDSDFAAYGFTLMTPDMLR